MKTIIKLTTMCLLLSAVFTVKAQIAPSKNNVSFIFGLDNGIVSGNGSDYHRYVLGGSFEADIPISDGIFLTADAGYLNFFHRDNINGTNLSTIDVHQIPVKAGIKYFPIGNFFVQAEAGGGFALNKSDLNYDKAVAFIYSPQIGYQFPLSNKNFIDAAVRYDGSTNYQDNNSDYSKLNYFALKLAYSFK